MIKLQLLVQQICLLSIILNVTKKKNWKTVRLYKKRFSKPTIAIRFIPSFFNVLSLFFFHVSLFGWKFLPLEFWYSLHKTVVSKSMKERIRKQIVHQIFLICTTTNVRKTVWRTHKLIINFNRLCSLTKFTIYTLQFLKTKVLFYVE